MRSSLQEQKEDLRKQLSYTTHKLEMLETEFDATKQYLETELRRAQEELEKFTDKLRRFKASVLIFPPNKPKQNYQTGQLVEAIGRVIQSGPVLTLSKNDYLKI